MSQQAKQYQIKISLKASEPSIWRRFVAPGDYSFYELHDIIQIVMGWEDEHLFQFIVGEKTITDTTAIDDDDALEADELLLDDVLEPGMRFTYEYDFGDGWEHLLHVEQVTETDEPMPYPVCLAGERACPPENSGGIWGYRELLEVLADPEHEDYDEMSDWVGEEFDPEFFDLEAVNAELQAMEEEELP